MDEKLIKWIIDKIDLIKKKPGFGIIKVAWHVRNGELSLVEKDVIETEKPEE